MPRPQKPVSAYVSPLISAREIVSRARTTKVPKQTLCSAKRIQDRLMLSVTERLLAEKAPYRVFRWVAWAGKLDEQRQRAELAVHLHRTFERRGYRWFDDVQHKAALDAWLRARAEALKSGRPPPPAEEVPIELYENAILAVPKRRRAPKPAAPVASEEDVLRMLRELRKVLVQQAATRTRKPPVIKLRASQTPVAVQTATAQEQAEAAQARDRLHRAEAEIQRLGQHLATTLAEKDRVNAENQRLRTERLRDEGMPWEQVMLLALGVLGAASTGVLASREPEAEPPANAG